MQVIIINNRDYNLIFNQDSQIKGVYEILETIAIPYGADIGIDNNGVIVISKNGRSIVINENELYPADKNNLDKLELVIKDVISFLVENSNSVISFDIDGINFVIKAYKEEKYDNYIMASEIKTIEGIYNIVNYLMKIMGKYMNIDCRFLEKSPVEISTKLQYLKLTIQSYIDSNDMIKKIHLPLP